METNGGGWTVFQRRQDGFVNFYRDWVDYENGFGNLTGEFWLGLSKIHRLTKEQSNTLRVDLEDFEGNTRYAQHSTFNVGNTTTLYTIIITDYSGTAGNSFAPAANGMKFSTKDADNDASPNTGGSCALAYKGGWWYNNCHGANLNGLYLRGPHSSYANGVNWYLFRGNHYSLKFTEMKVRRNY